MIVTVPFDAIVTMALISIAIAIAVWGALR